MNELQSHPGTTAIALLLALGAIFLLFLVLAKHKSTRVPWVRNSTALAAFIFLFYSAATLWLLTQRPTMAPNHMAALMHLKMGLGGVGAGIGVTLLMARSVWKCPPENSKPE